MSNNISHEKDGAQMKLITDFFRNQDVSNFCQCGRILPSGAVACMPDGTAEPLVVVVKRAQNAQAWAAVLVNPVSGKIVQNHERFKSSPCEALANAVNLSTETQSQIRVDLFDDQVFDWALLVERASERLADEGAEMALKWQVRWGNGDVRKPVTTGMHPIKVAAYQTGVAESDSLVWDVAEFDAHAVEEVARA